MKRTAIFSSKKMIALLAFVVCIALFILVAYPILNKRKSTIEKIPLINAKLDALELALKLYYKDYKKLPSDKNLFGILINGYIKSEEEFKDPYSISNTSIRYYVSEDGKKAILLSVGEDNNDDGVFDYNSALQSKKSNILRIIDFENKR